MDRAEDLTAATATVDKRYLFAGLVVIAILIGLIVAMLGLWPGQLDHKARDALATSLKDPDSAKFRNLKVVATGAICGEVNAKNSYGAYAGYSKFYARAGMVFLDSEDNRLHSAATLCGE